MNDKQHYSFRPSARDESITVSQVGLSNWANEVVAFTGDVKVASIASNELSFLGELQQQVALQTQQFAADITSLQAFQLTQAEFEIRTQKRIDQGQLVIADSIIGKAISALRQADQRNALIAQSHFGGIDVLSIAANTLQGPQVFSAPNRGITAGEQLARTFKSPPLELSDSAVTQLQAVVSQVISNKTALIEATLERAAKQMAEAEVNNTEQMARAVKVHRELVAELLSAKERLVGLETTYRFEGSVAAAFDHWDEKAKIHSGRARSYFKWFLAVFCVWGLVFVGVFAAVVPLQTTIQQVPFVAPALLALLSVSGIWVGRLISRQYLSERHLAEDAAERSALIRTFVSLLRERDISEERTDVVLAALFRSAATGLLKDDASPTFPTEILNKALERTKS